MSMKLWGSIASPYVARVTMFARLKDIDIENEPAPGGLGSDEFKKINPTGKIPALVHNGKLIAESEVICEYLDAIDNEIRVQPKQPMLAAHSRMVARATDLYVAPHNTPLRPHRDPANRDQAVVDDCAQKFADAFSYVEKFMGPGPFAAGKEPSIGDCALAPFIIMLQHTVFPYFDEIPDPTVSNPRIKTWWEAMQSYPEVKAGMDEYETALTEFLEYLAKVLAERAKG